MKKIILSILFSLICLFSFGQSTFLREGSTSGTNTYTATVTSLTSYTSAAIVLKFNNGNTSTSTININSIGAVAIRKWDGDSWEPLASGDIQANSDVLLIHDNTNTYFKAYVLPDIGQGGGGGGGTWGSITGTLSDQTDLQSALDAKQAAITFGTGVLTSLGVNIGSAGAPVLFNGAGGTPSSMTGTNITGIPQSGVTNLTSDLALKAPLASPALTGTPTAPTATAGTNTTQLATTAFVGTAVLAQSISSASASTSGGTITLDMDSRYQKIFVGSASFATSKNLALSNTTNALVFNFSFTITNVAGTIICPASFKMSDTNFNSGTDTWTPPLTGQYEMGGTWDGTNWLVKIAGPFN